MKIPYMARYFISRNVAEAGRRPRSAKAKSAPVWERPLLRSHLPHGAEFQRL